MKKALIFLFFVFSLQFVSANDFKALDALVNGKYDKEKFRKAFDEEQRRYEETENYIHLLQASYVQAFICGHEKDDNNKIVKLLWIVEHARKQDHEIVSYAKYHLASELSYLGSNGLALIYAEQALSDCLKYKVDLLRYCYTLKGSIFYKLKRYDEATKSYVEALKEEKKKDYLFRASMYNNISLCKMNQKDIPASNLYIKKSLDNIGKIKDQNFDVVLFRIIVEGNLGSNYFKLLRYEQAKPLLEKEIDFYTTHKINLAESVNPLNELLRIYTQENNTVKKEEIITTILSLEASVKDKTLSNRFTKILYDYYVSVNDYVKLKSYSEKLIKNNEFISDSVVNSLMSLNSFLYSQQVDYLKTQFESRKKLLNSRIRSKQNTTILLTVSFILVCIIFVITFIGRSRRSKRNMVIAEQNQLLEQNKRIILENEVKLKQEKITSLALNLNLKKETEKAFLEKIKEIKRKRNVEVESVLRELQHSVNNLLQIDNKNLVNSRESDAENTKFTSLLSLRHPELTEQEINFCTYFRMNLNSKEIASLNNMTSGTIRVYKTKIKAKIGLDQDKNLNEYLISLTEN